MIYILDLLNKIKWDSRENQEHYTLYYQDRIENKLKEIRYTDIIAIEPPCMLLSLNKKITYIPLHRIREIKKQGKVIWQRKV